MKIRMCMPWVLAFSVAITSFGQNYDVVVSGGRVLDPETGLDDIRNIGIRNGLIAEISSQSLSGSRVIDASGLVVSAGFIDLHVHGMTNVEQEYQVRDGVTTALELESGIPYLEDWYASRYSKALINYGASVNWSVTRVRAMDKYKALAVEVRSADPDERLEKLFEVAGNSGRESLSEEEIKGMLKVIQSELEAGGIGIGVPIGYLPGVNVKEDYRMYEFSGETGATIFTHVRQGGAIAIQQAISNAVLTDAPLHIVHVNSMALGDIEVAIEMVQDAQARGFDITTEMYPYTAASTGLESALFDEGWQEAFGISYGDLQWVATGERLTEKTFKKYRAQGGTVIIHMMKPEWIAAGLKTEGTIVASDGMPYAELAHPRTAGTFSRVLGKYVREDGVLTLNEAIEKMTLLPAKRLESIAPMMRTRGRIQVGMTADITIFDADQIIDKATFEQGLAFSVGVKHVLVNGSVVLENGNLATDTYPGQPVVGKFKR